MAPVRKIIDLSLVDGPGNRTAIFLQGCNIRCAYCHNPETQSKDDPEAVEMSPDTVLKHIRSNMPFIRGITVSGGECMLHPDWIRAVFEGARNLGLGTLIDSNGTIDFSKYPELMAVTDGIMLDIKSWDPAIFKRLTGADNSVVIKNLKFLVEQGRLEELRIVCLPDEALSLGLEVDAEAVLRGITRTIDMSKADSFVLRLIKFRHHGVIGQLRDMPSPSPEKIETLRQLALDLGFSRIRIS